MCLPQRKMKYIKQENSPVMVQKECPQQVSEWVSLKQIVFSFTGRLRMSGGKK